MTTELGASGAALALGKSRRSTGGECLGDVLGKRCGQLRPCRERLGQLMRERGKDANGATTAFVEVAAGECVGLEEVEELLLADDRAGTTDYRSAAPSSEPVTPNAISRAVAHLSLDAFDVARLTIYRSAAMLLGYAMNTPTVSCFGSAVVPLGHR